jgi:hypothetical protein
VSRAKGDPGLANERTALAWQRTALSLMASTGVMARLTWSRLGLFAVLTLTIALTLAVWVFFESRGRYSHDAGTHGRTGPRGGRAPAFVATIIALLAATELVALAAT